MGWVLVKVFGYCQGRVLVDHVVVCGVYMGVGFGYGLNREGVGEESTGKDIRSGGREEGVAVVVFGDAREVDLFAGREEGGTKAL